MGLDLSGLGTLLRRGIDDVGSAFTGQPAQSNPTSVGNAPNPVQRPQFQPQQQSPTQLPAAFHIQQPSQSSPFQLPGVPSQPNQAPGQRNLFQKSFDQINPFDNGRTFQNGMPNAAHQGSILQQATHSGIANGAGDIIKSVTNVAAAPIELGRSLAAVATNNPQAGLAADDRALSDARNNLVYGLGQQLAGTGKALYNVAKQPAAIFSGNQTASNNANTGAVNEFNKTPFGQILNPIQNKLAEYQVHRDLGNLSPQQQQQAINQNKVSAGLDPTASFGKQALTSGLGGLQLVVPEKLVNGVPIAQDLAAKGAAVKAGVTAIGDRLPASTPLNEAGNTPTDGPVVPAQQIVNGIKKLTSQNETQALKHFTDPEIAEQLKAGAPFDYTKDPIHGTGDIKSGYADKFVNDGQPALYLSKDDKTWSTAHTPNPNAQPVNIDHVTPQMMQDGYFAKNGITPQYDHTQQKWIGYKDASTSRPLQGVDYHVDPAARKLVIDSPDKLKQVAQQLGVHPDEPAFWQGLRKNYDVVDITNVAQNKNIEGTGRKFFKAAKADQSIVLNTDMVSTKPYSKIKTNIAADAEAKPTPQLSSQVEPAKPEIKATSGTPLTDNTSQPLVDHLQGIVDGKVDPSVPLPRSQQSGLALSKPTPAADIGHALGMTDEDMARASASEPRTKSIPNEPNKLTRPEREEIIKNNVTQVPEKQISLKTGTENIKGAVAEAVGTVSHERSLYNNVDRLQHKLSTNDRNLMFRYDHGEDIESLAKEADNPERFLKAATAAREALDHSLGVDRTAGGVTLRQNNYIPHSYVAKPEDLDALGIDPEQRFQAGQYQGFHDTSAKYPSYQAAHNATGGLLKPLHENPFDAIHEYGQGAANAHEGQILKAALKKAVPNDIGELGETSVGGNRLHSAPNDLPFSATDRVIQHLNGYREMGHVNNMAVRLGLKSFDAANALQKKLLFSLAYFHQVNISLKYAAATLGSGHPVLMGKGIGEALLSGINPKIAEALDKHYVDNGTAAWQNENGVMHGVQQTRYRFGNNDSIGQKITIANERFNPLDMMHRSMGNFINAYSNVLSDFAKDKVTSGTPEATALAQEYNALLGHIDAKISNLTPVVSNAVRRGGLAPQFLLSQSKMLKDATVGTKGAAYAKTGLGLTNATDLARTAVLGNRVINTGIAAAVTFIASGQMPNFQSLMKTAGLGGGTTGPNFDVGEKDNKGRHQIEYLPTDYAGLLENAVKDPSHFANARTSPIISTITRFATNKDWNGQPLSDPNSPTAMQDRALGAVKGALPIGVQNLTNSNLSTQQKVEQEFGSRAHVDPGDPQAVATKQYQDNIKQAQANLAKGNFSAIDPSLANVNPKYAAAEAAKFKAYQDLNPGKDVSGVANAGAYSALSNEKKAYFLTSNDQKTGQQMLSPIFYINQKSAQADPSRPHDPVYDLQGSGTGFSLDDKGNVTGSSNIPKAQIALDYANQPATSDQKHLMLVANPWLADYEKQVGDSAANYQQNMTDYMQKQGATPAAIADYFTKHPNSPPPIAPPAFSPETQKLLDDYNNLSDPTEKAQFFQDNAKELSTAYAADAVYKNQKAVAQGALPLQDHPNPSPEQAAALAQLQKNPNHDKAISKANGQLIQAHPELAQFLADSGLYNLAKNAAAYQYRDPSHPDLNQNQLINLGRPQDQATLKGIQTLGKYDVGKDANGKFSFLGAGGTGKFADGTASGSGGSGGFQYKAHQKKIKLPKARGVRPYRPGSMKRPHQLKSRAPQSHLHFANASKFTLKDASPNKRIKIG